jgi:hypothetical protein
MDLVAIFLLLLVLISVVLFVAQPFVNGKGASEKETQRISVLLAEREQTLNALQELDFDNELNKVPADEYHSQRERLAQKGMEILTQLDQLQKQRIPANRIREKPADGKKQHTALSDDEIENILKERRTARQDNGSGACPQCGKSLRISDAFCPACGTMVMRGEFPSQNEGHS